MYTLKWEGIVIYLSMVNGILYFIMLIPILILWRTLQFHWTILIIMTFLSLLIIFGLINKKKSNRDWHVATTYTSVLLFFSTIYFLLSFLVFTQEPLYNGILRMIIAVLAGITFLFSSV